MFGTMMPLHEQSWKDDAYPTVCYMISTAPCSFVGGSGINSEVLDL